MWPFNKAKTKSAVGIGTGWNLPITGGFLPRSWATDVGWWQRGHDPIGSEASSTVYACASAYAQAIAQLNAAHVRTQDNGARVPVTTSALSRVLRRPNAYQTIAEYMTNLIMSLMLTGNAYSVATRNDRTEVDSLHLLNPRGTRPMVEPETKELFYTLGSNDLLDDDIVTAIIPARDVLHIRLHTPQHPLIGVSPLIHLGATLSAAGAINNHQAAFFNRMARPSGVLTTDERLTREQQAQLLESWATQSQYLNSGGVPLLSNGLKWQALALSSEDAQLAQAWKLTEHQIAQAFRIPLPVIGQTEGTAYQASSLLWETWLSQGLGYIVTLVEQSFTKFFDLNTSDNLALDENSLLRLAPKDRAEVYSSMIQSGVMAINEARLREGLPPVEGGDVPFRQLQDVPLDAPYENFTGDGGDAEPPVVDDTDDADDAAKAIINMSASHIRSLTLIEGGKKLKDGTAA